MKIDVTDLFDSLFTVATLAYRGFFGDGGVSQADRDRWDDEFCGDLSDSYFVARAAHRAYQITHWEIPLAEVKRRIITPVSFGPLVKNMWYRCPRFYSFYDENPSAFSASFKHNGCEMLRDFLPRPAHSLTLHIGRVPKPELTVDRPDFDGNLACSYFRRHGVLTMFSGRVTELLETRGNWLTRKITIADEMSGFECANPAWIETKGLQQISTSLFQKLGRRPVLESKASDIQTMNAEPASTHFQNRRSPPGISWILYSAWDAYENAICSSLALPIPL